MNNVCKIDTFAFQSKSILPKKSSMIKRIVSFFALAVFFALASNAQGYFEGTGLKNYFFTGGGAGLQFGTETNIEVAPVFGYHLSNAFSVGIGGTYQFYKSRYYGDQFDIFGGRIFLRAQPLRLFFVHFEYEMLTYKTNIFSATGEYENVISENLLGGIGYREYISDRFSTYIMLMYNFNMNIYTPYSNPVFRFGIEYAFPAKKQ
jgi:hypothetical protein